MRRRPGGRLRTRGSAPLLLLLIAGVCAGQTTWTPELSMRVQAIGDVVVSPDGKMAAWTQTRAVMEGEKSENVTHIFLGPTDGSRRVQLTRGEKSANAPTWSPDGQWVFFASERGGKRNIYRIAVAGGEAETLTDWKGTLGVFQVSPDGKWIAFAGVEANAAEDRAKREKLDFRVIDESPRNHGLWVLPIEANAKIRKLFAPAYHVGACDWSPDSRRIAFEHRPTPEADIGRRSDISEVEVETGKVQVLAATGASEAQPRYSPDGRYVAFVRTTDPPGVFAPARVALLARQTGVVRDLAPSFDESPNVVDWAPDSARIYFTEAKQTRNALYAMPVDGPPVAVLAPPRGVAGAIRMNASGTHFGSAWQSAAEAPEAYVMAVSTRVPVRVSAANVGLPKAPLGETQVIQWKSKDGSAVEGLLTLPVGYASGKKVPLVLVIHGGPAGVFGETFIGGAGLYPVATFAAKGMAVLRANCRGSSGYGRKFRAANLNDWGGNDYQDLMAGVDHVIGMGVADPARLAVMGWSYGGYMTSWVVTQTTRFKAAAVGAGITNLWSMWGTNDIPSVLDDYFSGPPWEQMDRYLDRSAMYHVKKVTTPTLILHGALDPRVPTGQGYEFHSALKRRGVATKMVTYPRTQHGPQEPKFTLDIMQRHLDWVEQYVR